MEALTDGIFAIVMTLLVLDIKVPHDFIGNISGELAALMPNLFSFGVSFIVLGIFWNAHHSLFHFIKKLNNGLIWLNILFLLIVSLIPFSAALLGSYPSDRIAVQLYGIHILAVVLMHAAIRFKAHFDGLIEVSDRAIRLGRVNTGFSVIGYILALAASVIDTRFSLIIYAIIPLPYVFGFFIKWVK